MIPPASRVHFVGIGGAGMSALARVLLERGYRVSGCDLRASETTRRLAAAGIAVSLGHDPSHLDAADTVVASRAVPEQSPEIVAARSRGMPVYHRAQLLAQVLAEGCGIAVVGTHGKTTTAAMITHVLAAGGRDPTALIGADVDGLDGNVRLGRGPWVVAEVDESDGSLLYVRPHAAVVTSLDTTDHRDYYRTAERLVETFARFVAQLPDDGFAVLCTDFPYVRDLRPRVRARVLTCGLSGRPDLRAEIQALAGGRTRCVFIREGRRLGPVTLAVPGRYNVRNALAAAAVGLAAGVEFDRIAQALQAFGGVSRRFAVRGDVGGVMVVDDYAHNPVKVAAVLRAARESWPDRRVIAVFQPHRYTRTRTTYRRFATAFADADELIITELYPADEPPIPGVSASLIVNAIRPHRPVTFLPDPAGVVEHLLEVVRPGDLVLTLGAGDIGRVADALVAALRAGRASAGGASSGRGGPGGREGER
ncbi:MAG: UDP-N-acetylmuramate--L-alanine ligase [Armatimonadota bacterium]|nr:UDP-N-acetylmuramate--L-alanine ligase [Armatimonadota bacterium]MDR7402591.1 UDP-N-acetylmuramate--L-alanine ligase [Armatimonadota bacterium]MDR7404042.1 UDP-N-acetylmuramate--L-alanine ligase [Armatimonadota bacterium]MDR7507312.1 UDP-N-acetylmuramate--L-alanine ligase [Armatimonadota bacterium]MDR7517851.1 UDP-N-acetylmuramate--L-alanine ligase [Armatimonadota bacterium]